MSSVVQAPDAPAVVLRRNRRARRYSMRLNRDGELAVTIPRGGSEAAARRFVAEHRDWIERQRGKRADATGHAASWHAGTGIWLRGEQVSLEIGHDRGRPFVAFGSERVMIADAGMNLRRPVEQHLLALARRELPGRTRELAAAHGIAIRAVSVRNQASRWGSCSAAGTISLNWRLVQAPPEVRDYIILHELMHRREMNHSPRFWRLVADVCPHWRDAEAWLDTHATELGF